MGARVHSTSEAGAMLDLFEAHGHEEVDTARMYGNGSSEEMLADCSWERRGLVMETKLYSIARNSLRQDRRIIHALRPRRAQRLAGQSGSTEVRQD